VNPTKASEMPRNNNRRLLYIGFIGFVAIGMPGASLGVAWAFMQETFAVSLDSIGIVLTAITIGRLVMGINSGRFIGWGWATSCWQAVC
jgi:hypothetical protein